MMARYYCREKWQFVYAERRHAGADVRMGERESSKLATLDCRGRADIERSQPAARC